MATANELRKKCRACLLSNGTLVPIFSDLKVYDRALRLHEVLGMYGGIELDPNDELPQNICYGCVLDIAAAVIFRERCQKSDTKFRKILDKERGINPQLLPINTVFLLENPSTSNTECFVVKKEENVEIDEIVLLDTDDEQSDEDLKSFQENIEQKPNQIIETIPTTKEEESAQYELNLFEEDSRPESNQIKNDCDNGEANDCPSGNSDNSNESTSVSSGQGKGESVVKIEDKLTCKICNVRMKNPLSLARHIGWHGSIQYTTKPTQAELTCNICNKILRTRSLFRRHMLVHSHNESYECEHCGTKFKREKTKLLHIQLHHPEAESNSIRRVYQCPHCNKRFFKVSYEEHLRKHTGERPMQCFFCLKQYVSDKKVCEHQRYVCKKVEEVYGNEDETMDEEVDTKHPFEKTTLENGTISWKIRRFEWIRCGKYRCDICLERFPSNMQLERHKILQNDVPVCGPRNQQQLQRRNRTPNEDSTCRPRNISNHWENLCETCGKSFSTPTTLRLHVKKHNDSEIKYPCTVCDKKFLDKNHLKTHLNTHNPKCEFCDEQFTTLLERAKHKMVMHTDEILYSCHKCDMKFNDIHLRKRHIVNKHMKRNHCCVLCPFKFPTKQKLTNHMRVHTKEVPFHCGSCDRGFRYKMNLKIHERKFHPELSDELV